MHYLMEVVIPPTNDVDLAIEQVLAKFNENNDDGYPGFYDWYTIGGRYSGSKIESMIGEDRLEKFYAKLKEIGTTVSGLQWGKQELQPVSQIPVVDAIWRDMFPDSGIDVCPLFQHSTPRNQGILAGDICTVSNLPKGHKAYRAVIAGPEYGEGGKLEAKYMAQRRFWNGCNHVDTKWAGLVQDALDEYADSIKTYKQEWHEKCAVNSDWLVVTVDYHS